MSFLLAFESSPYAGVVRPFINWAKGLGCRSHIILYKCSPDMGRKVSDILKLEGVKVAIASKLQDVVHSLRNSGAEFLVTDDYYPRLKLAIKVGELSQAETLVYAQVLRNIHSIARGFSNEVLGFKTKLIYGLASATPFKLLSKGYSNLLKNSSGVLANSNFTCQMLRLLYGIEPAGVIYPPVDIEIFRPVNEGGQKNGGVLIYLGSCAGDTGSDVIKVLVTNLNNKVERVHLLGNEILYRKYLTESNRLEYHRDLGDMELAKLYSEVKLTICPQTWETFGYVQVESMACGTPVLTLYSHEAVLKSGLGWIAHSSKELVNISSRILNSGYDNDIKNMRAFVINNFSIKKSLERLLVILNSSM